MKNIFHLFLQAPAWVRDEFALVVVLMIFGWVIIGLVIHLVVRFIKGLTSSKKESKS